MKKSILAILLALVMVASLLPFGALAADNVRYRGANGKMQTCDTATVLKANSKTWNEGWYLARNTLDIDGRVTVSGDVHLILRDGCTLNITKGGIYVPYGSSLTIYGQSQGTGILNAKGIDETAGIGGKEKYYDGSTNGENGDITINGGVINATGGSDGAGIGSGFSINYSNPQKCGKITINGGTVTATGGNRAAGIGGGYSCFCPDIEINGGTVNAKGGTDGAGIGSAIGDPCKKFADGAVITIKGNANVTAMAGDGASGIGSGYFCKFGVKQITINGNAVVNATGGVKDEIEAGAGIGAGYYATTDTNYKIGTIVINGNANVTATGGNAVDRGSGSGIGAGSNCQRVSGTIRIMNGTVNATSGDNGAGIGVYGLEGTAAEFFPQNLTIVINGGDVSAIGGKGIDCGTDGSFDTDYNDKPGSAFISTSSMNNTGDGSDFNCIVKIDDDVTVYGENTLKNDLTIPEGGSLTINNGAVLIIPEGVTLTVEGDFINNGQIINNGTVLIDGSKLISLPESVVYNGTNTFELEYATITTGSKNIGAFTLAAGTGDMAENEYTAVAKEGYMLDTLGELTITAAPLKVIADDIAVLAGSAKPELTYKTEGLFAGDELDVVPTLTCEANMSVTGTYEIVISGASAANYTVEHVNGTLTVQPSWYVTIKYDNGAPDKVVILPAGSSEYTLPAAPSKSGYAFLGWACSDGKTYSALETVTITKNTTFTAVWVRHPDTPYVPEPEEPEEPEVPEFPFYDVPTSAWYYTAVKYVYDNKLMDGVDTYVFAPNDTLTRAMVWTIIARMSGVDTTGGNTWYAKAQEWVITNGISDGENPTAAITREQLVTMLYRYAQIKGYDVSVGENTNILSYVDATSISEYAVAAFQWSCGSGLTEGDENGALTPLATATRAQAAAMIMRFCQSVK